MTDRSGPMDQQTRMFKTLGFLIGAMTAASILLFWMDPTRPTGRTASTVEILDYTRSLVSDRTTIRTNLWDAIEIVAGAPSGRAGRMLSASPDRRDCHFLVDEEGRASCMDNWVAQRSAAGRPGVVRIEVCQRRRGEPMTVAQSDMLRALVASLSERIGAGGELLPVRLVGEEKGISTIPGWHGQAESPRRSGLSMVKGSHGFPRSRIDPPSSRAAP